MSEQNDNPETLVVSVDGGDPVPMVALDAIESTGEEESETAVETELTRVEEIRGETIIAVAAIEADVETARIEADTERNRNWESEREALQASITELAEQIANLEARLSPAPAILLNPIPLPEEEQPPADPIAPELNLTPQSIAGSETQTEPGPDEEEESAEAVALVIPDRKRRRLI